MSDDRTSDELLPGAGIPGPEGAVGSEGAVDERARADARDGARGATATAPTWSAVEDEGAAVVVPPPTSGRRVRRGRRTLLIVLLVLVVPLAALAGALVWVYWQIDPPGSPGPERRVQVRAGWGVSEIADHLDDRGIIGSSLAFQIYARATGSDSFQAGRYLLRENMGVREAVEALEAGPTIEYRRLAVIPGLWLTEIAAEVERQVPWLDGDRFLQLASTGAVRSAFQPEGVASLEGFLWPDTYQVAEGEDEIDVLRTMVREFDRHAEQVGLAEALASPARRTPYEVLTVASLIQQEARVDVDRRQIASVIYNRLDAPMRLQIDATVLYCIGERRISNTEEDRATPCPHNTYQVDGLPPGPISSVTEASLRAALDPEETPFLFYVLADDTGRHAFAQTYEEHLANVERAREQGLLG
jgi:UPF0755 protein